MGGIPPLSLRETPFIRPPEQVWLSTGASPLLAGGQGANKLAPRGVLCVLMAKLMPHSSALNGH